MYGELTDKEAMSRIDESLDNQLHEQLEVLLYKKNSTYQFCKILQIKGRFG